MPRTYWLGVGRGRTSRLPALVRVGGGGCGRSTRTFHRRGYVDTFIVGIHRASRLATLSHPSLTVSFRQSAVGTNVGQSSRSAQPHFDGHGCQQPQSLCAACRRRFGWRSSCWQKRPRPFTGQRHTLQYQMHPATPPGSWRMTHDCLWYPWMPTPQGPKRWSPQTPTCCCTEGRNKKGG